MTDNEKNQKEQKGTANRFKKAAEKQKRPAGGIPEELTAGTTASVTAPAEENNAAINEQAVQGQASPVQPEAGETKPAADATASLALTYEATLPEKPEPRSVRLQAVITPTLNEKLNDLVKGRIPGRKIQSKNDLINFLLERYFDELK